MRSARGMWPGIMQLWECAVQVYGVTGVLRKGSLLQNGRKGISMMTTLSSCTSLLQAGLQPRLAVSGSAASAPGGSAQVPAPAGPQPCKCCAPIVTLTTQGALGQLQSDLALAGGAAPQAAAHKPLHLQASCPASSAHPSSRPTLTMQGALGQLQSDLAPAGGAAPQAASRLQGASQALAGAVGGSPGASQFLESRCGEGRQAEGHLGTCWGCVVGVGVVGAAQGLRNS